jgi:hypothetical protein
MYLYYTVSSGVEAIQLKPQLSLGGYKSSVKLRNSQLGNLFGDITPFTITTNNQNQYAALILKNETGAPITTVKMWFEYPADSYSKLRVAAVDLFIGVDSVAQMEHIDMSTSKPLNGDFFEADGEANPVDLGDMVAGEMIGIWIERELLIDFIKLDSSNVAKLVTGHTDLYEAVELNQLDEIKIGISWT